MTLARRVGEGAALVAILVAQALLFGRVRGGDTDFDEGVYLAGVDALRHGDELGTDLFAAQPPGFYHLLEASAALAGNSVSAVRTGLLAVFLLGTIGAYLLGRALAGSLAGLGGAALLTVAPPVPFYAARVLADPPGIALSAVALAAAAVAWRLRDERAAVVAGALLAAALSVKLAAVIAVPPLVALLLLRRPPGRLLAAAAGGGALVSALLLAAHVGALGGIWDGAVAYHRDAREAPPVLDRSGELLGLFNVRTPAAWLFAAGVALAAVDVARRRRPQLTAVWLWPAGALVFLLFHEQLHENHLVVLPAAGAVAAGATLGARAADLRGGPRAAVVALVAIALAAGYVQQHRRLADDVRPEEPELVEAATALARTTTSSELVLSDQPIVAYLAGRRIPGEVVDTAFLRFATGWLSPDRVLEVADEECVAAAVLARSFNDVPGLRRRLEERFPRTVLDGHVVVRTRPALPTHC